MSGRWDQTPDQYDRPSDHETRVSEAAVAVAAIPKRPRVMRVSGETQCCADPGGSFCSMTTGLSYCSPGWYGMAASDYPDEPRPRHEWPVWTPIVVGIAVGFLVGIAYQVLT